MTSQSNGRVFNQLIEVSKVMSGPKRMLLLYMLSNSPKGYSGIAEAFKKEGIKIGSSEVYKHLYMLIKNGLVSKSFDRVYSATLKGCELINIMVRFLHD